MFKRNNITTSPDNRKLIGIEELQGYLSVGRATATKIGKDAGAVRKLGKRLLYDRAIIDNYIDSMGDL